MKTFIDRGGTFTDVVTVADTGEVSIAKVPSDRAVIGALAAGADGVSGALTFGTTVATNALLTRSLTPTLLLVTRGFVDLPLIRDQTRPALFDADAVWPPPLAARVAEVGGRVDAEGREIEPLALDALPLEGIGAVAVVLINSHRNPSHERIVAEAVRAAAPGIHVTLGHEVVAEVGYLARMETALVDAAVTPVLRAALVRDRVPDGALAMRSDGSLCPWRALRAPDAVLSGPAGGALAVAAVAAQAGFARAVGLDMGGTSTDVCRVDAGRPPRREGEVQVAGVHLSRPMIEVETIAAGGGSVLASDGLTLTVGPESAGADPGPACYGRGGPPTLTDAALLAGLMDPGAFEPPLDPGRVSLPGDAAEFLDVAREAMAAAVRRIATARGVDLADHALVAYGGAAGQHAAAVAERLGIGTVLVHPAASALSAWGQALARREERASVAVWAPLDGGLDALEAAWSTLAASLPVLAEVSRTAELRYAGTDHPLEVSGDDEAALADAFRAEHQRRFGFDRPNQVVEIVNARVRVRAAAPSPLAGPVDDFGLGGETVEGPRLLTIPTTSVHVPGGWTARVADGLLRLERTQTRGAAPSAPTHRTPHGIALWSGRFMAVATQAGEVLRRLARSVNIRERRDFSCAIFDGEGALVANAPHIPVHLGAMGETVRDLLARHPDVQPGQAWLTNDPAAGGSHLPDLTVVTAVVSGDRRWFVACRGHHVDVGGLTPGSMPPRSRTLADEGLVFRQEPLLDGGALRSELTDTSGAGLLAGCREPEVVRADLEAQIASNAAAARALTALGPPAVVDAWMAHLRAAAGEAVASVIASLPDGQARDSIDGVPLAVSLRREMTAGGARLVVDFAGTGKPHKGNLNAPTAVVRAAVLYGLRCLVGREVPLNDGALSAVDIRVPTPSILSPPEGAAVVGGNVETSQRLVDLFLRAAGARAAGQGTMNNLTLGGELDGVRWSLYETLGGGGGASAAGPGISGRQVHMTNTRATDPEVIEARLPLRVRRFALRGGTGGAGAWPGGDGLIREIEVLAPARAALLATRRGAGAPGLNAGAGVPGRQWICRGGVWEAWEGDPIALAPGDRVRVETPGGGGWSPEAPPSPATH